MYVERVFFCKFLTLSVHQRTRDETQVACKTTTQHPFLSQKEHAPIKMNNSMIYC